MNTDGLQVSFAVILQPDQENMISDCRNSGNFQNGASKAGLPESVINIYNIHNVSELNGVGM